jgi:hypothetical protein
MAFKPAYTEFLALRFVVGNASFLISRDLDRRGSGAFAVGVYLLLAVGPTVVGNLLTLSDL